MSEYLDIIWRNSALEGQVPVDAPRSALRIRKADRPGVVLLILPRLGDLQLKFVSLFQELSVKVGDLGRNLAFDVVSLGGEIGAVQQLGACQHLCEPFVADALIHAFHEAEVLIQRAMNAVRSAPSMRLAASPWRTIIPSDARFTITFTNSRSSLMYCSKRPLLDLEQRRLRNVDVVALDQLRHMAEEEGQQERSDVRSVHVRRPS